MCSAPAQVGTGARNGGVAPKHDVELYLSLAAAKGRRSRVRLCGSSCHFLTWPSRERAVRPTLRGQYGVQRLGSFRRAQSLPHSPVAEAAGRTGHGTQQPAWPSFGAKEQQHEIDRLSVGGVEGNGVIESREYSNWANQARDHRVRDGHAASRAERGQVCGHPRSGHCALKIERGRAASHARQIFDDLTLVPCSQARDDASRRD